jgi:hypothetical protein
MEGQESVTLKRVWVDLLSWTKLRRPMLRFKLTPALLFMTTGKCGFFLCLWRRSLVRGTVVWRAGNLAVNVYD